MKLPIENWINEKGYGTNIKRMFHESIICYKNDANRASLLFSYLGFLTIIKETIIKSNRPLSIQEGRWNNILSEINKDDKWESALFDELINSSAPIFNMNENLRQQVKYWKDRRNDCAHFKRNEIEPHHIDSFWSFLKSNISKMTIEGGMESLINKFVMHFDETFNAPNKNFDHLVNEIINSVDPKQKEDFFKRLNILSGINYRNNGSYTFLVYNRILEIGDEQTQEELVSFIKKEKLDINFLNEFSEKVTVMSYNEEDIRAFWKLKIYSKNSYTNPYNLFSSLLRNRLIPSEQIEEAFTELFNRYSQTEYKRLPELKDIGTLQTEGFFRTVCNIAIVEYDLNDNHRINNKSDIIALAIENTPLNPKTVKTICNMVSRSYYSWWLTDCIVRILKENLNFKKEFTKIAKDVLIIIPSVFK